MAKIWNKSLGLTLNKNKTLFTLFKVLVNETRLKSRSLDLHNRLIFDHFIKPNVLNMYINVFKKMSNVLGGSLFRQLKFSYFFFNSSFSFFSYLLEEQQTLLKQLLMCRQFCSLAFKSIGVLNLQSKQYLRSANIFFWNFNFSFMDLKKKTILTDFDFVKRLKKTYINEEGKRLFSRNVYIIFPFFFRFYNRNFKLDFFVDSSSFFTENFKSLGSSGSFNKLFFILSLNFIFSFYYFFFYLICSFYYLIHFFISNLGINSLKTN